MHTSPYFRNVQCNNYWSVLNPKEVLGMGKYNKEKTVCLPEVFETCRLDKELEKNNPGLRERKIECVTERLIKKKLKKIHKKKIEKHRESVVRAIKKNSYSDLEKELKDLDANQKFNLLILEKGYWGKTVLHKGVEYGNKEIIKLLLEGLSVYQKYRLLRSSTNYYFLTVLHDIAARHHPDDVEIVTELLAGLTNKQKYNLLGMTDSAEGNVLHSAANGQEVIVTIFLEALTLEQKYCLLLQKGFESKTPLHYTVGNKNMKIAALFLRELTLFQKKNLLECKDRWNRTPLFSVLWIVSVYYCYGFIDSAYTQVSKMDKEMLDVLFSGFTQEEIRHIARLA